MICLIATIANAQEEGFKEKMKPYLEKLRPYISEYLGEEWEVKLLGEKPETILLPPIPKVVEDATSTEIYDNNEDDPNVKPMDPEDEEHFNYLFVNVIICVNV